ncbi:MAG: F0F1 ATP synthase subunit A [Roseiflexaceae bacterium]|nr:F0F1 ATP synthase subunit A [Roseiflexaceae bacterium]
MLRRFGIVCAIIFVVGLGLYLAGFKLSRSDLHISAAAEPIFCLAGQMAEDGEHCASGLPITNSVIMTIIADLLLLGGAFFATRNMQLIPRGWQNTMEYIIEAFYDFARGVDAKNVAKFFPIVATIFLFLLVANMTALVPGVNSVGTCIAEYENVAAEGGADTAGAATTEAAANEAAEPPTRFSQWPLACPEGTYVKPWLRAAAADLNMTFGFAFVAVFLIQLFGFQALGLGYLTKFFNFNGFKVNFLQGILDVFIGLIELISEVSRILSFAFRLFGNIFAGEVVLAVMAFLFPYILPLPFWGLELFVAFMQAFIFATLTLVFMSLATLSHEGHGEHGAESAHTPLEAPSDTLVRERDRVHA